MFTISYDNMRNTRDTNTSLSISLRVPFLELMDAMIWAGFVAFGGGFSTACVTGTLSSKQNGKILTKAQFNFLSLQSMYNYLTECIVSGSPSSKTFLK